MARKEWLTQRWNAINAAKDMARWWSALNKFRVKGRSAVSDKINNNRWIEHFKNLLNNDELNEKKRD